MPLKANRKVALSEQAKRAGAWVRLDQVTEVSTANHPANFMPGRPFDRIEIASAPDTIPIMPSFHRREELEELLRYIYSRRPEAFTDPLVTQYMDGAFSEWWRYR